MKLSRWLFGFGLAMVLAGPSLQAESSDADRPALPDLCAKAESGDVQSRFELGQAFYLDQFGVGVAQDYAEAAERVSSSGRTELSYGANHFPIRRGETKTRMRNRSRQRFRRLTLLAQSNA